MSLAVQLDLLRALLAEERQAVARLDGAALDELTARKQSIAAAIAAAAGEVRRDRTLARRIAQLRVELEANAALASAARHGVRVLLGHEPDGAYDRRARQQASTRPIRVLAL